MIDLGLDVTGVALPLFGRIAWGRDTRYYFLLFIAETAILHLFEHAKAVRAELPPRPRPDAPARTRAQALEGNGLTWFLLLLAGGATLIFTLASAGESGASYNPSYALPPFDPVMYVLPFSLIAMGHLRGYWRYIASKEYQRTSIDDVAGWAGARVFFYLFFFFIPCAVLFGPWVSISIIPIALFTLLRMGAKVIEFLSPIPAKSDPSPQSDAPTATA